MSPKDLIGGRYRLERRLDAGAMGEVFLAHDVELERLVALKLLDEQLAGDHDLRVRFTREAQLAARLSHPNLVTVFDVGETGGRPYIVMEYVDGPTLEELVRRDGALEPARVREIARDLCAGLEHAHGQGLVHRDLKPGNVIARGNGRLKIADFGIASGADRTALTEPGTILGTAAYLAPEQAEGRTATPQTDLYALGVVLHELLTGRRPWETASLAELGTRRAHPSPLPATIPRDLRTVVARCLSVAPQDRPASAAEVAQLLEPEQDVRTVVLQPRRPLPRIRALTHRRAAVRAGAAVAVLALASALAGVGGIALRNDANSARADGDNSARPAAPPPRMPTVRDGATPADDARNLGAWLRANSR